MGYSLLDFDETLERADVLFAESLLRPYPHTQNNALFLATLFSSARQGHLCLSVEDPILLEGAASLPSRLLKTAVHMKNGRWYLKRNKEMEERFLFHVERLTSATCSEVLQLEAVCKNLPLQEKQKEALCTAANYPVTILCGGPGTGKTYTAATFIHLVKEFIPGKLLAGAPTGKATAILREKLPVCCEVQTLQRFLANQDLYDADLVLIDEASMIDARAMTRLFSSVKQGSRLILLGDPYQLPPVETGQFFADLVRSGKIPTTELTCCLRTDLADILDQAQAVKRGEPFLYSPLPEIRPLLDLLSETIFPPKECSLEGAFHHYSKTRVLSPLRKGPYGTANLSEQLYRRHIKREHAPWIPLLIIENAPHLNLYNGDLGLLNEKEKTVCFADGKVYPHEILPKSEKSYILSVHKSQGSEFDEVLLLIPEGSEKFGREVLYTAITRARKKIKTWAEPGLIESIVSNQTIRHSGLLAPG